jgi:hypothetical protein
MNNYIKDKLRLKLNLHLSSGKKREGVIDEKVIDKLSKEADGLGKYEIIYRGNFPVGLVKLSDDFKVEYKNGKYYLTGHDLTHCINANEFIDFNIKEYRNIQLKKLLS